LESILHLGKKPTASTTKIPEDPGIMSFFSGGGGGVLYFDAPNKHITATWIDSQKLEVVHDKDIVFTMQENRSYYCGDDVKIIYKIASPDPSP
jgi:hypothetical protein